MKPEPNLARQADHTDPDNQSVSPAAEVKPDEGEVVVHTKPDDSPPPIIILPPIVL